MVSAECLTGWWSAVLGVMWRAVRQQRVDAVGLRVDGVHGQLLPEGFLFSPVGEPVVDAHLRDQIGAEALSLGGWHASLETFGSAGNRQARWVVSGGVIIGRGGRAEACTCCTPPPGIPAPPCWGSSAAHMPGTGSAGKQVPIWNGCALFSCWRVRCWCPRLAERRGCTLGKST